MQTATSASVTPALKTPAFANTGQVNTGFRFGPYRRMELGYVNTGARFITNSGASHSGFNNTAGGTNASQISGFFNSVSGGSSSYSRVSGLFNTGVTGPLNGNPAGVLSGFNAGFFNMGTGVAGFFSLTQLLKNL